MKKLLLCLLAFMLCLHMSAQDSLMLYPGGVPGSKSSTINEKHNRDQNGVLRISDVSLPSIAIFRPSKEKNSHTAVIICPGGGYARLAASHEGTDVAKFLTGWGITAIVLKYRLPNDTIMQHKSIGPLQDAQRAIQLVKQMANEWDVDTNKVGIMGFSAGGHLASTAGTHFNKPFINNAANVNLRPSFMILCYPVISFSDSITHKGSRVSLLGKNASAEEVTYFSNELQVTNQTPPSFIVHAGDDRSVPVENSLYFFKALHKHQVPSELHIYPKGGHGFGMFNKTTTDNWMDSLYNWMKGNGWAL